MEQATLDKVNKVAAIAMISFVVLCCVALGWSFFRAPVDSNVPLPEPAMASAPVVTDAAPVMLDPIVSSASVSDAVSDVNAVSDVAVVDSSAKSVSSHK